MRKNVALDTNVLLYLHYCFSPAKRAIAKDLLSDNPFVPSQDMQHGLVVEKSLTIINPFL